MKWKKFKGCKGTRNRNNNGFKDGVMSNTFLPLQSQSNHIYILLQVYKRKQNISATKHILGAVHIQYSLCLNYF